MAEAEKPTVLLRVRKLRPPPLKLILRVTGAVVPSSVKSPSKTKEFPLDSTKEVDAKVACGKFSTSNQLDPLSSSSNSGLFISNPAVLIITSRDES